MSYSEQPAKETSRRNFLRSMAAAPTLALATGSSLLPHILPSIRAESENRLGEKAPTKSPKFVAIQIGARSFVDEGVDACLDTLQQTGSVNVVMATVSALCSNQPTFQCRRFRHASTSRDRPVAPSSLALDLEALLGGSRCLSVRKFPFLELSPMGAVIRR
jgi:hypothetical protein